MDINVDKNDDAVRPINVFGLFDDFIDGCDEIIPCGCFDNSDGSDSFNFCSTSDEKGIKQLIHKQNK